MEVMAQDPSIDFQKVKEMYPDNYTNKLLSMRLDVNMRKDEDDDQIDKVLRVRLVDERDDLDKKHVKQKRFDFIGVKPKIDTHIPLTKE